MSGWASGDAEDSESGDGPGQAWNFTYFPGASGLGTYQAGFPCGSRPSLAPGAGGWFASVDLRGVFGSERYMELHRAERERLDALLRKDPLRVRRLLPRRLRQYLYDRRLSAERLDRGDPRAAAIEVGDFPIRSEPLDESLDLIAICREPRRPPYLT